MITRDIDRELQMLQLRYEGKSYQEIAEEFEMSKQRVWDILDRLSKVNAKSKAMKLDRELMKTANIVRRQMGVSINDIAEGSGFGYVTVRKVLENNYNTANTRGIVLAKMLKMCNDRLNAIQKALKEYSNK